VRNAAVGEVFEAGLAREDAMRRICRVIARQGGAILAIDYGYARTQTGETLQAMRKHQFADMLEAPGETDISAHVDFEALGDVARREGLLVPPVATQREFLQRLGIEERAAVLSRANPEAAGEVTHALARLVAREQMGDLFKVICAHAKGLAPAGFAA
jgi:SAM-dependent MidA family methyltransferase